MKKTIKRFLGQKILGRYVRRVIRRNNVKVIAVVGSVGKTSTKAAIATLLGESFKVRWQQGNYNDLLSVPLIFFGLTMPSLKNPFAWLKTIGAMSRQARKKYPYDIVVVELGSDAPGQIVEFSSYLHPDMTVVTAISPEHMEFFKHMRAVAKEELSALAFSSKAVINVDDVSPDFRKDLGAIPIITFGTEPSDVHISKISPLTETLTRSLTIKTAKTSLAVSTSLLGKHSIKALAAAVAVGLEFGMDETALRRGIQSVQAFPGRMRVLSGKKDCLLIDDTYNASPFAAKAALECLYEINDRPRVAVLGSMNELGSYSEQAHKEIGAMCYKEKLTAVVTIGKMANDWLAMVAGQNGVPVMRFESPYAAGWWLAEHAPERAAILFKGSQFGVFAEEAVKVMLADSKDKAQLVRQTPYWLAQKRAQFIDAQ